jgi:TonB family protein
VLRFAVTLVAATVACGGSSPPADAQGAQAPPPPESEAPVALNPDVPIAYPPALFEQRIEGEVVLRLFTDSTGRLIPESTRVAESSNYPALDSAALAGSARLRFAPAKRRGVPIATMFLQPVEFHYPGTAAGGSGGSSSGSSSRAATPTVTIPAPQPVTPPPVVPRPRRDTVRAQPDTLRPKPDTTRQPVDTARPPADTTGVRRETSGAAH